MKNLIFSYEKKILDWIDERLPWFVFGVLTVFGVFIRYPLRDFVSLDFYYYLEPWFYEIQKNGISAPVGNYNLLYQFLIYLMTKLPLSPLYSYKLLSCLFDGVLAVSAAMLAYHLAKEERVWKAVVAYGAVLLSPIVFLNSAAWAQCDSIFVCFAVLSLLFLMKENYSLAMVLLGLSFSFKLQAVFLLPLFLFVYFARRHFSLVYFLIIPVTMFVTCVPMFFYGRGISEMLTIYVGQTGYYEQMVMNYPSVWSLLLDGKSATHYGFMKLPAILVTIGALMAIMVVWLRKRLRAEGENLLFMAFILAFTAVLLLPGMHERYGFLYEILAVGIAIQVPKTTPLCASLLGISFCTYGGYLFRIATFSMPLLTVFNIAVFCAYFFILNRKMEKNASAA